MSLDEYTRRDFKQVGTRVRRPDGVDKVTGRAMYGADATAPGMLVGRILRSPHAHAKIKSIDTSAAKALAGVKAIVTAEDFAVPEDDFIRDVQDNCMARGTALYDGHAVAAVAATDAATAKAALKLIKVDYEILPHVTDVDEAMKPGAPVVQKGRVQENVPAGHSENVTAHFEFGHGDLEAGFAKADKIIKPVIQDSRDSSGLYRTACLSRLRHLGRQGRPLVLYAGPVLSSAPFAPRSWGWRQASCASLPRKSAAALAARPPYSSNRSHWLCRKRRAARSRS